MDGSCYGNVSIYWQFTLSCITMLQLVVIIKKKNAIKNPIYVVLFFFPFLYFKYFSKLVMEAEQIRDGVKYMQQGDKA